MKEGINKNFLVGNQGVHSLQLNWRVSTAKQDLRHYYFTAAIDQG
jgi:hypothetical protein